MLDYIYICFLYEAFVKHLKLVFIINKLNEALNGIEEGIELNNIRFVDDNMVIVDSLEGLQRLMDRITQYSQQYG